MEETLQIIIDAIKDYGAAVISTLSVGGIAAVAGVIAKIKSAMESTKETMNSVLAKKDEEVKTIEANYGSLVAELKEQNAEMKKITEELTKIKR